MNKPAEAGFKDLKASLESNADDVTLAISIGFAVFGIVGSLTRLRAYRSLVSGAVIKSGVELLG